MLRFTNIQFLLGFFLMTSPASASLRGTQLENRQRELLDANQLEFSLLLTITVDHDWAGFDQRPAESSELDTARTNIDNWITKAAYDVSFDHVHYVPPMCTSDLISESWTSGEQDKSNHDFAFKYTCTFQELTLPMGTEETPYDPTMFIRDLNIKAVPSELIGGFLDPLPNDNIFSFSTEVFKMLTLIGDGSSGRNVFNENYVLPYQITWDFDTDRYLANQKDYFAVQNATKVWLEENWAEVYILPNSTERFELRTTQVKVLAGSFYSQNNLYSQSVSLDVELLIGANNITDVPSVQSYTTAMRYFYKISHFNELLKPLLEPDSVLHSTNQTTYAVTPTWPVTTLEERVEREDDPPPENAKLTLDSIAVVSINV